MLLVVCHESIGPSGLDPLFLKQEQKFMFLGYQSHQCTSVSCVMHGADKPMVAVLKVLHDHMIT